MVVVSVRARLYLCERAPAAPAGGGSAGPKSAVLPEEPQGRSKLPAGRVGSPGAERAAVPL